MIRSIGLNGKPNRFLPNHNFTKGEKHPNWKGGQFLTTKGYKMILCPDHPYCDKQGYVREHRRNWELHQTEITGKPVYLHPSISLHHIDGDRTNNHWSNLMPISAEEHTKLHKKKDMTGRFCSEAECKNPNETQNDSDGNPCWFKWPDGTWRCKRCYNRIKKRERDARKKSG
jgi:hypothetical protein